MSRVITHDDIESCRTIRGGFTTKTIFALTGSKKPLQGWKNRAVGKILSDDLWEKAYAGRVRKKPEPPIQEIESMKKLKSKITKLQHANEELARRVTNLELIINPNN